MKENMYKKLSAQAQADFKNLVSKKENAINMLVNNLISCGGLNYDYAAISGRMQVQYFALNPNMGTIQTNGKDGWWQNEAYEPSTVCKDIFPIIEEGLGLDEVTKRYFSSFALKEVNKRYALRYPLFDDFTSSMSPFIDKSMPDETYNEFLQSLKTKLGVRIINGTIPSLQFYKRSFAKIAILKIKNAALKMVRKPAQAKAVFSGEMVLATKNKSNYKYSNVEKVVKIFDEMFRVGISKEISKAQKPKGIKATKELKFASRLFASMLIARIHDFNNLEINRSVEKCLSLQFANVINRARFDAKQMRYITLLGSNAATEICKELGLTKENIIKRMVLNGYEYPVVPSSERQALLLAREKDFSKYVSSIAGTEVVLVDPQPTPEPTSTKEEKAPALPEGNKQPMLPEGQKHPSLPAAEEPQKLQAPNISGLLPPGNSKNNYSVEEMAQMELERQKQKYALLKKLTGVLKDNLQNQQNEAKVAQEKKATEISETAVVEEVGKINIVSPSMQSVADAQNDSAVKLEESKQNVEKIQEILPQNTSQDTQTQFTEAKKSEKPKLTAKLVEKIIDKNIIKLLAEKNVKIANCLNAHKYSAVGGKQNGEKMSLIISNVLGFYQTSILSTRKLSRKADANSETIYSRAKQVCSLLNAIKKEIANKIVNAQANIPSSESEKTETYINKLHRSLTQNPENPNGYTIREYFKKYIDGVADLYAGAAYKDVVVR